MSDPSHLIVHWGYPAIFFFVFLGNLGLPVPEESILMLAGFLVWKGNLKFLIATAIGIAGAISGDNFGYWIGYRYGAKAALRYRRWAFITPDLASRLRDYIERYGATAVFLARFFPGARFMAGPLAGTAYMPFRRFFIANLLGALTYVPLMVTLGYAVSIGLGDFVRRFERVFGRLEYIALLFIIFSTLVILGWRVFKIRREAAQLKR
jgi:membrane protein DedA with SNARE-associated domain